MITCQACLSGQSWKCEGSTCANFTKSTSWKNVKQTKKRTSRKPSNASRRAAIRTPDSVKTPRVKHPNRPIRSSGRKGRPHGGGLAPTTSYEIGLRLIEHFSRPTTDIYRILADEFNCSYEQVRTVMRNLKVLEESNG